MTVDVTLPRAIIELNLMDIGSNEVLVDLWRVPSAAVVVGTGGYKLYRAKSRSGFAGTLGDDDTGHEDCGVSVSQPAATTVRIEQTLTAQPADVDLFYAARVVDDTGTPARFGEFGNVVKVQKLNDRQVPVPVCPTKLEPSRGALNGLVRNLQDEDTTAGMTWYEFARVRVEMGEAIWEAMMDTFHDESAVSDLMRRPPVALTRWYTYEVCLELLPTSGIPEARRATLSADYVDQIQRWRDLFYSGNVLHTPASTNQAMLGIGRVIR